MLSASGIIGCSHLPFFVLISEISNHQASNDKFFDVSAVLIVNLHLLVKGETCMHLQFDFLSKTLVTMSSLLKA